MSVLSPSAVELAESLGNRARNWADAGCARQTSTANNQPNWETVKRRLAAIGLNGDPAGMKGYDDVTSGD